MICTVYKAILPSPPLRYIVFALLVCFIDIFQILFKDMLYILAYVISNQFSKFLSVNKA